MSAEKLSPRQQMISLMYLVLLAMLAMNASKSLLDAFTALDHGIDNTNRNFAAKNEKLYKKIEIAAASVASAKPIWENAQKIKTAADELFNKFQEGKDWMVEQTGGLDENGIPLAKDNQDIGAQYYMVNEGGANGENLEKAVDDFKDLLKSFLDEKKFADLRGRIDTSLATEPHTDHDGIVHPWISMISEHIPMAAVMANLTLWQSYIRNMEAEVVSKLAASVEGEGIVVNTVQGMLNMKAGYVLKGDSVFGDVFISAYNSDITPEVLIGIVDTNKFVDGKYHANKATDAPPLLGSLADEWDGTDATYALLDVKGGKGIYAQKTSRAGVVELEGVIKLPNTDGSAEYYMYKQSYMVAEPSATVAATKMNVFYIGVENPVAVSAPGVSAEDIDVRGSGLTIRKKGKDYVVTATKASPKATISVFKKGESTKLGSADFRVKRLPDPVATILGFREGLISKGQLAAATFLKAEMDNFDFDLRVEIKSFDLTMNMDGDLRTLSSKSKMLTPQMTALLKRAKRGGKVYFENIKAKMPDGSVRSLGSISLKVK